MLFTTNDYWECIKLPTLRQITLVGLNTSEKSFINRSKIFERYILLIPNILAALLLSFKNDLTWKLFHLINSYHWFDLSKRIYSAIRLSYLRDLFFSEPVKFLLLSNKLSNYDSRWRMDYLFWVKPGNEVYLFRPNFGLFCCSLLFMKFNCIFLIIYNCCLSSWLFFHLFRTLSKTI